MISTRVPDPFEKQLYETEEPGSSSKTSAGTSSELLELPGSLRPREGSSRSGGFEELGRGLGNIYICI